MINNKSKIRKCPMKKRQLSKDREKRRTQEDKKMIQLWRGVQVTLERLNKPMLIASIIREFQDNLIQLHYHHRHLQAHLDLRLMIEMIQIYLWMIWFEKLRKRAQRWIKLKLILLQHLKFNINMDRLQNYLRKIIYKEARKVL